MNKNWLIFPVLISCIVMSPLALADAPDPFDSPNSSADFSDSADATNSMDNTAQDEAANSRYTDDVNATRPAQPQSGYQSQTQSQSQSQPRPESQSLPNNAKATAVPPPRPRHQHSVEVAPSNAAIDYLNKKYANSAAKLSNTNPNTPITNSNVTPATRPFMAEPYGMRFCHKPGFRCVPVPPKMTWETMWPNQWQREIIMRLNRTNIPLNYRRWIIIPTSWEHFDYLRLAPFPDKIAATGQKQIMVDLSRFAFAAYNQSGYLVYWGPATGGRSWCDDQHASCQSAAGNFQIYRMQGADCMSSKFDMEDGLNGGAPMPYCMHYYQGYSLHGSTLLGFINHSRGCVHLFADDAKWLNQQFVEMGTKITVKD